MDEGTDPSRGVRGDFPIVEKPGALSTGPGCVDPCELEFYVAAQDGEGVVLCSLLKCGRGSHSEPLGSEASSLVGAGWWLCSSLLSSPRLPALSVIGGRDHRSSPGSVKEWAASCVGACETCASLGSRDSAWAGGTLGTILAFFSSPQAESRRREKSPHPGKREALLSSPHEGSSQMDGRDWKELEGVEAMEGPRDHSM